MKRSAILLVRSPYVGRLVLEDGRTVFCHVLGKVRLACQEIVTEFLDAFARPTALDDFFREVRDRFDADSVASVEAVIDELRSADLIQPVNSNEVERIRRLFSHVFEPVQEADVLTRVGRPARAKRPGPTDERTSAIGSTSTLVLSNALAVLRVAKGEYLVTHPLERRLHLAEDVWRIARRFARPAVVRDVARKQRLPVARVLDACRFLVARRILWPSREAEQREAARLVRPGDDYLVDRLDSGCEQWEQKYLPYRLADLVPVHRVVRIAAIGACQVHASTPALRFHARRKGIEIEVSSWVSPNMAELRAAPPALVLLSLAAELVDLYEAIALRDHGRCRFLIPGIAAQFDRALARIREQTDAPVLVHSAGHPGLGGHAASSPASHHLNSVLAELNDALLARSAGYARVYVMDQNRAIAERAPRVHWDDEHNALRHHSAISAWGRLPRDLGSWGGARPGQLEPPAPAPPVPAGQRDPAVVFALAHLDFLERLEAEYPVRLIVFEPNGLLWPGSLDARDRPFDEGFNFYTGDFASKFLGIHEALRIVGGRGIALACVSSCAAAMLRDRWQLGSSLPTLLRPVHLSHLDGGPRPKERLLGILRTAGVPEEHVLLVNMPPTAVPKGFRGRVIVGAPWELRRYLLTAPELNPLDAEARDALAPRVRRRSATTALASNGAEMPADVDTDRVETALVALVSARLRCDAATLASTPDLRSLGLDSLGSLELVTQIETRLGIVLPDSDRTAAVVFSVRGLRDAALRALRRRASIEVSSDHAPSASELSASIAADIPSVLADHFASPTVPWIFKFLRSTRPNDYQYVTWAQLAEQAMGYLALYRERGLVPGDLVTIAMPQGLPLVASIVGAFLGRMVPAVSAFPSEKLTRNAFSEWFAKLVAESGTRLVVCDAALEGTIASELAVEGLRVPVCATVPAPRPYEATDIGAPQPSAPALVQYSSGTTGVKKAVLLTHEAVLTQTRHLAATLRCADDDVIVSWLPLYHDMGYIACFLLPLIRAIPTVMMSPFDWVKQPHVLFEQIAEERGTLAWLPNFAFLHCARRVRDAQLAGLDLSSLRAAISCSEPVTHEAMDRFYDKLAPYGLRRSALASSYAMAETTFAVTQSTIGTSARRIRVAKSTLAAEGRIVAAVGSSPGTIELVSSGRVLPGTTVEIVDRAGAVLGEGRVGEIRIRSDSLMKEYFKAPAATESAVRDGWYDSGDLGFLFDGELYVTGRAKEIMIIAGQNVYPHEVEQAISAIAGVKPGRVVAFGVFDEAEGTERCVVLAETELLDATAQNMAEVKATIRNVIFDQFAVALSDIELFPEPVLLKSTSGKLSRGRNRASYLERRHAVDRKVEVPA